MLVEEVGVQNRGAALSQCFEFSHAPSLLTIGRKIETSAEIFIGTRFQKVNMVDINS